MKKTLLRKSILAIAVLLILSLSLTITNTFLAQSAPGGNYLTVTISGQGTVELIDVKKSDLIATLTGEDAHPVKVAGIKSIQLQLTPAAGFYVSAFKVGDEYINTHNTLDYTLSPVPKGYTIEVSFSEEGAEIPVPLGSGVTVFPDIAVALTFNSASVDPGLDPTAQATEQIFADLLTLAAWDIETTVTDTDGVIQIAILWPGAVPLKIVLGDSYDAVFSDVNYDGVVNGDDVSDVAVVSKEGGPLAGNEHLDVNNDDKINEEDVRIVNSNQGPLTELIQDVDWWIEAGVLYIETEHFSIFRCR
ncbi:hypothetical protein KAI12_04455 [Candidatus Bathyarchaeota archaeon]|nr:hypothetical protein [Candidatus Bathyarchaeota archaeon]